MESTKMWIILQGKTFSSTHSDMNEALFLLSIIYPSFPCTLISRTGFVIKMLPFDRVGSSNGNWTTLWWSKV